MPEDLSFGPGLTTCRKKKEGFGHWMALERVVEAGNRFSATLLLYPFSRTSLLEGDRALVRGLDVAGALGILGPR
jgi:hypothetical protein